MITMCHWIRARTRAGGSLAVMALAATVLVSACGSGGQTAASAASTTQTQAQQICQQVSAVLSDGPDPGADPVGYAQAQILPLEQLHVSDQTILGQAITTLASDYSSYIAANGTGKAANSALTAAINRINSLCPGAGART
jgi:hypothetical protein